MKVVTIPALEDNYIFCIVSDDRSHVAVVDPGEVDPVQEYLNRESLHLSQIWVTHHHADHTGGIDILKRRTGCQVLGSAEDLWRIPAIDVALESGSEFVFDNEPVQVISTPGHTIGAISFFLPRLPALFCGDTLFSLGCGRLFEGTAKQMYRSLATLAGLDPSTEIYCAHEYTEKNGEFALSIDPTNTSLIQRVAEVRKLRDAGLPTVPVSLKEELRTNPFLRADIMLSDSPGGSGDESPEMFFGRLRKVARSMVSP